MRLRIELPLKKAPAYRAARSWQVAGGVLLVVSEVEEAVEEPTVTTVGTLLRVAFPFFFAM